MKFFLPAIIFLSFASISSAKGFNLKKLPKGSEVTLPYPATTFIPLNERVTLSATDSPQSLKMTSRSLRKGIKAVNLMLAIFDRNLERVKYLTIKPGVPYVYSFNGISSIMIIPKLHDTNITRKKQILQVESDKSLTISR